MFVQAVLSTLRASAALWDTSWDPRYIPLFLLPMPLYILHKVGVEVHSVIMQFCHVEGCICLSSQLLVVLQWVYSGYDITNVTLNNDGKIEKWGKHHDPG